MMAETYENFMVYGLESTGEKVNLNLTEDEFRAENGQNVLDSNQVLVIVKEDLRRIFIWKGVNSHVRKKFISSRIAAELQNNLVNKAHFHRCKIISIDQGDEPDEFMRAFGFTAVEPPKFIDRDSDEFKQIHATTIREVAEISDKEIHTWNGPPPIIDDIVEPPAIRRKVDKEISSEPKQPSISTISTLDTTPTISPKANNKHLIEKIVNNEVPDNFKRQNLLIGTFQLYGAAVKTTKVFGEEVEETKWEPVNSIPKGPIELVDRTIRLYTNDTTGKIEGIEILQNLSAPKLVRKVSEIKDEIDYSTWTVSNLKLFCKKNNIHVPSSYRKAQIIDLILKGSPQKSVDKWIDYDKWTVEQLQEYCNENSIEVLSSYRKADLIKLVKEHQKQSSS
ncbi:MAG: hypothetical protein EAX91_14950 [Candidatus Lokiarchaeota archaeon]|nr:hypothetical protein [Candidatus Lokiarchaeota archaeon]